MIFFNYLPMVRELDVGFAREYEMYSQAVVTPRVIVPVKELGNGGSEMNPLRSSTQIATMPWNESGNETITEGATNKKQSGSEPSDDKPNCQTAFPSRILRSTKKQQEKIVEGKKPKAKGFRAKAGSVKEHQAQVEDCSQSWHGELKNTREKLATSEKALQTVKAQLSGREKDLNACKEELQKSNRSNIDLRKANRELRGDLKASQGDLLKCKDDLFSLQKVAQDPDSIISSQFERINQQIANWVDKQTAAFEKAHPETEPDYFSSACEEAIFADFLRRYPDADDHLARNLIHRLLDLHLFERERYLFGMPEWTKHMLQEVEHEMAKLDPPRDSVAIASWRSETLKAFAETTEYGICSQRESQELNIHLLKELFYIFPALCSGPQTYDTFYEQVLLPAVEFANMIRKSTYKYDVSIPQAHTIRSKPVTKDLLKQQKMVDYESRKHLKPNSAVIADKDGVIGNAIICLEPALYRVIEGKEKLLLQGTVLVELNQPLPKRIRISN